MGAVKIEKSLELYKHRIHNHKISTVS